MSEMNHRATADEAHGQSPTSMGLLPCPFCGTEPLLTHFGANVFTVHCGNEDCGVGCETSSTDHMEALKAWNTRPSLPAPGREEILKELASKFPISVTPAARGDLADFILALSRPPENVNHRATEPAALRSAGLSDKPVVSIKPMALSDGRTDYFVSIKVGERDVTPHVFREEYKAAYHVALYDWLLNGSGEEPCPVDFGPDDWPAKVHTPVECAEPGDAEDRMIQIEKLIADLQSIKDRFGNTCVYIRRGGLSWGAVALNRRDDDQKHGVFDLQAQHDRDMLARLEQIERLKKDRDEWRQKVWDAEKTSQSPAVSAEGGQ